ncbi:MAG: hypothetical protein ACK4Y5_06590 [Acetobacteraceae bacterium]|jgi:hypothetical protein
MAFFVQPQGIATVLVPAGGSIAVFCQGQATVSRVSTSPNYPDQSVLLGTVNNGQVVFGSFTNATTVTVEASGGVQTFYEVGTSPAVSQNRLSWQVQPTPGTLNASGTLSWALISSGIVTSTTAAAVTGTLPTGAVMDASSSFAVGDSVDFTVINTGATNAFTVAQAASGHTVVGNMTVALSSSGRFRTTKTAAATFVTYRLS